MNPSLNPEKIHNRVVEVNLLTLFEQYEKENQLNLISKQRIVTREQRIEALQRDALEFADIYEIGLQLHHYRITPKMLAEAYLDML